MEVLDSAWFQILAWFVGTGAVGSFFSWLTHRRQTRAQVKTAEAQASELLSKTYANLIKDLNDQLRNLKGINKELEDTKEKLLRDMKQLETEVERLRKEVTKLTNKLAKYEGQGS